MEVLTKETVTARSAYGSLAGDKDPVSTAEMYVIIDQGQR